MQEENEVLSWTGICVAYVEVDGIGDNVGESRGRMNNIQPNESFFS